MTELLECSSFVTNAMKIMFDMEDQEIIGGWEEPELPDTCCPVCMHDCYGEKPKRFCLECDWKEDEEK